MNKAQELLGEKSTKAGLILYLAVGLVQLWAIPSGLAAWFEIHWILAVVGAAVLAWVPVLGQAAALAAAVDVLGWPVSLAVALFLWPLWFVAAVLAWRRFSPEKDAAGEAPAEDSAADAEWFRRRIGGLVKRGADARPAAAASDQAPPTERPPPAKAV